jgi:YidC/Oxa1 family membrane protein insertase
MQDGHPPLGWYDTICYLVLPVLLVASQYVSMEIMKPPQVNASLYILSLVMMPITWFNLRSMVWHRVMTRHRRTHSSF